jgi:hypothetical protein
MFQYGEPCLRTYGALRERGVMVVYTEREGLIRVISMRKASRLKKRSTSKASRTDWARVDAMRDEDIDFSDVPEATPEHLRTVRPLHSVRIILTNQ